MIDAGLIVEGGGMRGVYAAGVLDFLIEKNLIFKNNYAVSAGSCHVCSYLSKQHKRAFRINVNYLNDKRYCSFESLIKTGDLFGVDMLYNKIPNELDVFDYEEYDKFNGNFYAVVTNLNTGKPEYKKIGDLHEDIVYIRASSSLPMLSRNVKIGNEEYLDGGVSDSIPIRKSIDDGNIKNLVILTRDKNYRKSKNSIMPIIKLKYRKYPNLVQSMANRHIVYNDTLDFIEQKEASGEIFVIRPSEEVKIGRIEKDKQKLEDLYYKGYFDAKKSYESLKKYLGI